LGSAAYPEFRHQQLREQIISARERLKPRYNVEHFLVYFQAYTNTFARVKSLNEQFEVASQFEDVFGFVVGTRPDCISDGVFELWNKWAQKLFLAVEFGVQSFNEEHLLWMERGHTAERSIKAIHRTNSNCPDVDLGIHLIFGLPGETDNDIINSANICNSLPIDNVKLHNLHVLKETPLEEMYNQGDYVPMTRDEYTDKVILFLQHLKPTIAVHRLTAVASRHDELVAPDWAKSKLDNYQFVIDSFKDQKAYQGQYL